MIRTLRRLLLSAALGASVAVLGCDKKLTEVEVPEAGVSLRYDLTPGQVYNGHVKWKNTMTAATGQQLISNLEFDTELLVTGVKHPDGPLLRATTKNIKVNVAVPDGVPPEATGLSEEVAKKLNGAEIAFNVDELGKVSNEPKPPADLDRVTQATISLLTQAVVGGLVRVPENQLKKGDSWQPNQSRDGLTTTGTGTLESLVQDESGTSLAKLWLEVKTSGERELEGQKIEVNSSQTIAVLFPTDPGFPASVERKLQMKLPMGMGDLASDAEITWQRGEKRDVETMATPAETQDITDPCDADYVGPEECKDGTESQEITDPCDGDYVGPEECKDEADPPAEEPESK